jgi:hypothetical protein
VRVAALGLTWVAATAGFGSALLSRAGTRTGRAPKPDAGLRATGTVPVDRGGVPVWQTPTPIGGIVAARRPMPVPPPRSRARRPQVARRLPPSAACTAAQGGFRMTSRATASVRS